MVLITPVVFFCSMPFGVAPAAIQQMMPNTMRSQASALYLFVINLIGMGLGPRPCGAAERLRLWRSKAIGYSLLVVGVLSYVCRRLPALARPEALPPQPGIPEGMEQCAPLKELRERLAGRHSRGSGVRLLRTSY